ncbi:MAG: peptidylprolyl isomerase [Coriobacteriales bacterium]|nr:peptidylprolyl isomerase [Coriobacteriales bacterium]
MILKKTYLCVICLALLTGCSAVVEGAGVDDGSIAATVNGKPIPEIKVTQFIETYRSSQGVLQTAELWAETLNNAQLTPEKLRLHVIDAFIEAELIKQDAESRGIEVDSDVIEKTISDSRSQYSTKEAWLEELANAGYPTEADYRLDLESGYLRTELKKIVAPLTEPTEAELQEVAPQQAGYYVGKRSSHILFRADGSMSMTDVKAQAQGTLDALNGGADFSQMAASFSDDPNSSTVGGDVGWEKLSVTSTFGTEYSSALAQLAVGEYSGLVETSLGVHIIYCTDEFRTASDGTVAYEDIPAEILQSIAINYAQQKRDKEFADYLEALRLNAQVTINGMSSSLPYYVDMGEHQQAPDEGISLNPSAEAQLSD